MTAELNELIREATERYEALTDAFYISRYESWLEMKAEFDLLPWTQKAPNAA